MEPGSVEEGEVSPWRRGGGRNVVHQALIAWAVFAPNFAVGFWLLRSGQVHVYRSGGCCL